MNCDIEDGDELQRSEHGLAIVRDGGETFIPLSWKNLGDYADWLRRNAPRLGPKAEAAALIVQAAAEKFSKSKMVKELKKGLKAKKFRKEDF